MPKFDKKQEATHTLLKLNEKLCSSDQDILEEFHQGCDNYIRHSKCSQKTTNILKKVQKGIHQVDEDELFEIVCDVLFGDIDEKMHEATIEEFKEHTKKQTKSKKQLAREGNAKKNAEKMQRIAFEEAQAKAYAERLRIDKEKKKQRSAAAKKRNS